MIVSSLIIIVSVALFLYWFRYTCILILSTKTTKDYSEEVATANQLHFVEVRGQLPESTSAELDAIQSSLERDYRMVTYLQKQAADFRVGGSSLEEIMLRIDFRVMKAWYALARPFSESVSRAAVQEMSQIVGHFANSFGEQAEASVRT